MKPSKTRYYPLKPSKTRLNQMKPSKTQSSLLSFLSLLWKRFRSCFFLNFYRTQFLYLPTASSWKCVVIFQLMFVCVSAFQSRFPPTAFFCSSAIRLAAAFSLASLESVIPEADGDRLGFVSTSTRTRQPAKKPGKNSNNDNNNKKKQLATGVSPRYAPAASGNYRNRE